MQSYNPSHLPSLIATPCIVYVLESPIYKDGPGLGPGSRSRRPRFSRCVRPRDREARKHIRALYPRRNGQIQRQQMCIRIRAIGAVSVCRSLPGDFLLLGRACLTWGGAYLSAWVRGVEAVENRVSRAPVYRICQAWLITGADARRHHAQCTSQEQKAEQRMGQAKSPQEDSIADGQLATAG